MKTTIVDVDKIRVYLTGDSTRFLNALYKFIDSHEEIRLIGKAHSAEAVMPQILELKPEIVVVQLSWSNLSSFEIIPRVKAAFPKISIIVVSLYATRICRKLALEAGGDVFIPEIAVRDHLVTKVRQLVR